MRVWFDGQCLQTQSHGRGIGRYVRELICGLHDLRTDLEITVSLNLSLGPPAPGIAAFADRDRIDIRQWQSATSVGEFFFTGNAQRRLSDVCLAHHVACMNPDIAISASLMEGTSNANVPFKKLRGFAIPSAVIFFDAIPHRFRREYISQKGLAGFYKRRVQELRAFDLALCISESAAIDAHWLCPTLPSINISSGAGHAGETQIDAAAADAEPPAGGPYVFYVGGLDWHKNVDLVADAFARLSPALRSSHALWLAGPHPPDQAAALAQRWRRHGLDPDKLVFLGYLSDADLLRHYRSAEIVVQPSRHEGFGLTAAEAMLAGAPVIASSGGALPEVIGRADLLFDPAKADQLAALLTRVLTDKDFRARAIAHGHDHAQQFTWQRTAERASEALNRLAGTASAGYLSVDAARAWTQQRARELGLPPSVMADALARAEPSARYRTL